MYPKVEINLENIIENALKIQKICLDKNIKLSLVTKVLSNNEEIVRKIVDSGISCICESRIQNLKSYDSISCEKWLIREPSLCEIEDVVKYSDLSLNSEITTIKELNEEAKRQNKIHKIIIMYELGDLREGAFKEEVENIISETLKLSNIKIEGIGVNLSCYGAIMPSDDNMNEFQKLVIELEEKFNINFEIISGGNSTSYEMLISNKIPKKINNLRIGELVFLGNIPCIDKKVDELNNDNFILKAQITEIKEKPSVPWGISGEVDSFGNAPTYEDKGIRKRALLCVGKQDVNLSNINPIDSNIKVIGGSSDYVIVDITDSKENYKIGDIISFKLNYAGVLEVMSSNYITKEITKK